MEQKFEDAVEDYYESIDEYLDALGTIVDVLDEFNATAPRLSGAHFLRWVEEWAKKFRSAVDLFEERFENTVEKYENASKIGKKVPDLWYGPTGTDLQDFHRIFLRDYWEIHAVCMNIENLLRAEGFLAPPKQMRMTTQEIKQIRTSLQENLMERR